MGILTYQIEVPSTLGEGFENLFVFCYSEIDISISLQITRPRSGREHARSHSCNIIRPEIEDWYSLMYSQISTLFLSKQKSNRCQPLYSERHNCPGGSQWGSWVENRCTTSSLLPFHHRTSPAIYTSDKEGYWVRYTPEGRTRLGRTTFPRLAIVRGDTYWWESAITSFVDLVAITMENLFKWQGENAKRDLTVKLNNLIHWWLCRFSISKRVCTFSACLVFLDLESQGVRFKNILNFKEYHFYWMNRSLSVLKRNWNWNWTLFQTLKLILNNQILFN